MGNLYLSSLIFFLHSLSIPLHYPLLSSPLISSPTIHFLPLLVLLKPGKMWVVDLSPYPSLPPLYTFLFSLLPSLLPHLTPHAPRLTLLTTPSLHAPHHTLASRPLLHPRLMILNTSDPVALGRYRTDPRVPPAIDYYVRSGLSPP